MVSRAFLDKVAELMKDNKLTYNMFAATLVLGKDHPEKSFIQNTIRQTLRSHMRAHTGLQELTEWQQECNLTHLTLFFSSCSFFFSFRSEP